ncbi:general stress protein [Aeromicrobium sp. CF4.19]|uniref:general stress protein n=1 Tax=Aeromicrobium sp. CF4.19 TaxID=3373082 RepID=UPI003EE6282C
MAPVTHGPFALDFPQSLGVFDDYAAAQAAVDHLADEEFPVKNVLIVGTDLKQVERVTGRLTTGRVALMGAASGAWLGLFIGLLIGLFAEQGSWVSTVLTGLGLGVVFGVVWSLLGYAATRGQRDFSSVSSVVATKYEVLVEHKLLARGQELLAQRPGQPVDL